MNELAAEAAAEPGAQALTVSTRSSRDTSSPRRRQQTNARAHAAGDPAVAAAMDHLARHRETGALPDDLIGKSMSVTTLETYLRCPLGWLIGRYVDPWEPGGDARNMGTVADDAMSAALRLGGPTSPVVRSCAIGDRVDAALECIRGHVSYAHIPRGERDDLEGWVVRAICKYFNPDYMNSIAPGWVPVTDQAWLSTTIDGVRVTGKADRIDLTDKGLLVIDWKLQRSIAVPGRTERGRELQRGLYPYMARGTEQAGITLPDEVLGFMYVSFAHGDHNGTFTSPVGGGGAVDTTWRDDRTEALKNAAAAIAGIREGRVWQVGDGCRASYCGHHHMSDTAAVRT